MASTFLDWKNEKLKFLYNLGNTNHSKREYKILLLDKENDKFFISDENSESLFPTQIKKGQIYFSNTFQNDEEDEKKWL